MTGSSAFREEITYLRAVFDDAPIPYVVTDTNLIVIDANKAAERLWGLALDSLKGQGLSVLIAPSDYRAFLAIVDEIMQAPEPVSRPIRLRASSGRELEAMLAATSVRDVDDEPGSIYWLFSTAPPPEESGLM